MKIHNVDLKIQLLIIIVSLTIAACEEKTNTPQRLKASFAQNRILVKLPTRSGDTLSLIADTGGGAGIILDDSIAQHLGVEVVEQEIEGRQTKLLDFDKVCSDPLFPVPGIVIEKKQRILSTKFPRILMRDANGLLGHKWFSDHVWTIDYPNHQLYVDVAAQLDKRDSQVVELGFQKNIFGVKQNGFPRITIKVGDEQFDMLFDTGASAVLTDSSRRFFDGQGEVIATSFIIESVARRWRERNPSWPFIAHAEQYKTGDGQNSGMMKSDMIQVPEIEIGNHKVGPVWFTTRSDKNFTEGMSQYMDKPVHGAIGGSALKYFKITLDYKSALAKFERPL